jgi:hypothetical protein
MMAFRVLRVTSVARAVAQLTTRERRDYDAAVTALRGEGCRAGGKRLMAQDRTDHALCQRALHGQWRMTTAYPSDGSIVVISLARHARRENPNAVLADVLPELSVVGRRRSAQPACCEDPARPPTAGPALSAALLDVFGV